MDLGCSSRDVERLFRLYTSARPTWTVERRVDMAVEHARAGIVHALRRRGRRRRATRGAA